MPRSGALKLGSSVGISQDQIRQPVRPGETDVAAPLREPYEILDRPHARRTAAEEGMARQYAEGVGLPHRVQLALPNPGDVARVLYPLPYIRLRQEGVLLLVVE